MHDRTLTQPVKAGVPALSRQKRTCKKLSSHQNHFFIIKVVHVFDDGKIRRNCWSETKGANHLDAPWKNERFEAINTKKNIHDQERGSTQRKSRAAVGIHEYRDVGLCGDCRKDEASMFCGVGCKEGDEQ